MSSGNEGYIPRPDGEFGAWAAYFAKALEDWWTNQGLDLAALAAFQSALNTWETAYPANTAAQAAAESARQAKDAARKTLESLTRPLAQFVQNYPTTTDADRATLGITIRRAARAAFGTPASRPRVRIDAGSRLTHRLTVADESTPTRRARPEGVIGAEVWMALVPPGENPPTDPNALTFRALATRPTSSEEFEARDGGKTAVYMLRWISKSGERGPWSDAVTATVAA